MVTWGSRFGFGLVTVGAGHVDDDALVLAGRGIGFVFDGGEGAEEEIRGIGHDGGAAGGGFVAGLGLIEVGQGGGDGGGGGGILDGADGGGGDGGPCAGVFVVRGVSGASARA